jgi:hypothetical protein
MGSIDAHQHPRFAAISKFGSAGSVGMLGWWPVHVGGSCTPVLRAALSMQAVGRIRCGDAATPLAPSSRGRNSVVYMFGSARTRAEGGVKIWHESREVWMVGRMNWCHPAPLEISMKCYPENRPVILNEARGPCPFLPLRCSVSPLARPVACIVHLDHYSLRSRKTTTTSNIFSFPPCLHLSFTPFHYTTIH